MCFDICTINIRVSIRVRGLHLVFKMVLLTGAKCVFIWCFFFKIVLVVAAKRGGLEVDVCVDDVK